jgi:hypothetical protein
MTKGEIAFRPMAFTEVRSDRLCGLCVADILAGHNRVVT